MSERSNVGGPFDEPLSRTLARFASGSTTDLLNGDIVHCFKRSLLDFLGCTLAGSAAGTSEGLRRYCRKAGYSGVSTVIGTLNKLPPADAALVNGAAAHAFDYDEGHTRGGVHPAAVIFPAALAVAEQAKCSVVDTMLAVVLGYEIILRLCSFIHPESAKRGWHNTAITGSLGAAAAAAKLQRLDADAMQNAFGLAASFTGGTLQFFDNGADTKRLHPGKAARDGILCAGLAAEGFHGPDFSLDGKFGLLPLHGAKPGIAAHGIADLGKHLLISGVYFKPYPCNRHFHAALEALLDLKRNNGLSADQIERIEIATYRAGVSGHMHTRYSSLFDAQSSLPFMAALVFINGAAPIKALEPALAYADVATLAARVSAHVDADCERAYPAHRSAKVTVVTKVGHLFRKELSDPLGEAENPISDQSLECKFMENCADLLGEGRARGLAAAVWHCEQAKSINELLAMATVLPTRFG